MGRGMQIAVLVAVIVGGSGGGLAALLVSPPPPPARGAPSARAVPAPVAPTVTPILQGEPSEPANPDTTVAGAMKLVLHQFLVWARDHASEPCPDIDDLAVHVPDPWGRPFELTCTGQPADQIIGAVSAGPDGIAGNSDDVASWALGREVTELVRGARWRSTNASATRGRPGRHRKAGSTAATSALSGPVVRPSDAPGAPASALAAPVEPASAAPAAPAAPAPPGSGSAIPAVRSAPIDAAADDIPARRSRH